ncbi:MAG TPA: AAA family ATPase [Myxococcaceae bacterium]|jgi:MoxR-like ATPase
MTPTNGNPTLAALLALRADLVSRFPEREAVVDGALCALLAGEHVLLLGPPGTAKSALVRALAQSIQGRYFERLLTKYSTPDELFGPISLKALENDSFTRVVTGTLPEAELAFVDEVFKANSAILNTLLTLLNERVFHNSGPPTPCPLVSLFAASNELPEGKELEALFDRFLLRFEVSYLVRRSNFRNVLTTKRRPTVQGLDMAALRAAQQEAEQVRVTDTTVDALMDIRDGLKPEGVVASDRRWVKSLRLAQAAAYLAGATETTPEDLSFLVDSLWREPKDRAKVARVVGPLADPVSFQATEILDAALEQAAKVDALRAGGDRQAFLAQAAKVLDDFKAQQKKLNALSATGRRAKDVVAGAVRQVQQLHADLARTIGQGLGLNVRAAS